MAGDPGRLSKLVARADQVVAFKNCPCPHRQAWSGNIAVYFRLRPDQHRPLAGDFALDLPPHDQSPAHNAVDNHIPLFLDRDHAAGFDRAARRGSP